MCRYRWIYPPEPDLRGQSPPYLTTPTRDQPHRRDVSGGPLSFLDEIWEENVPKGFNPLSLKMFDMHNDFYEHISITTQMDILESPTL